MADENQKPDPNAEAAIDPGAEEANAQLATLEGRIADVHRVAGDVVHLPTNDDYHRHLRNGARQPRQPIGAERRDLQWRGEH